MKKHFHFSVWLVGVFIYILLVFFPICSFAQEQEGFIDKASSWVGDLAENIPIVGNFVKKYRSKEKIALQKEHLETSKSSLKKIQEFSRDMLEMKRKVEEADAIRQNAQRLYKNLVDANYGKVSLGITESILGIDLNPGSYIPNISPTRKLKRDCSFSLYREKALLRDMDYFQNRTKRFFNYTGGKEITDILKDLREEAENANRSQTAIKEANNKLIAVYERQIKELAEQNKQIEQTLSDQRFEKSDPVKYFTLKKIQNDNNIMAADLIERINKIRKESNTISKEDKKAMSTLASRAIYQELLRRKIDNVRKRNSK